MTQLRIPGGTDVAEMALFDVDSLPDSHHPDESTIASLAASDCLIRFPTGADGGYLLHLYVDEPIPAELRLFCLDDDQFSGVFRTKNGKVAFGGLESAFAGFKPNAFIRSDATIPAGEYHYIARRTEFPDDLVDRKLRVETNANELRLSRAPVALTLATIVVAIALAVLQQFWGVGLVLLAGYLGIRAIRRSATFQDLRARRDAAQLDLPSIVVELGAIRDFQATDRESSQSDDPE